MKSTQFVAMLSESDPKRRLEDVSYSAAVGDKHTSSQIESDKAALAFAKSEAMTKMTAEAMNGGASLKEIDPRDFARSHILLFRVETMSVFSRV